MNLHAVKDGPIVRVYAERLGRGRAHQCTGIILSIAIPVRMRRGLQGIDPPEIVQSPRDALSEGEDLGPRKHIAEKEVAILRQARLQQRGAVAAREKKVVRRTQLA